VHRRLIFLPVAAIALALGVSNGASAQAAPQTVIIEEAVGQCPDQLFLKILIGDNDKGIQPRTIHALPANCERLKSAADVSDEQLKKQLPAIAAKYYEAYRTSKYEDYQKLWATPGKAPKLRSVNDCGNEGFTDRNADVNRWIDRMLTGALWALARPAPDDHGVPTAIAVDSVRVAAVTDVTWDGDTPRAIGDPNTVARVRFQQPVSCGRFRWTVTTWEWLLVPTGSLKEYKITSQIPLAVSKRK
jgi:hypothetical protein